jgi:hypothetical protein
MRPNIHHRTRPKGFAPMLVMRGIKNDALETKERIAIQAFELGYATPEHYDFLCEMQGIMLLAGSTSEARSGAMHYAHHVLGPVMLAIKARYGKTGKLGCSGDEIQVLRGFVSRYRDFWLHQPTELFIAATAALQKHHHELAAQRAQEKTA